MKKTIVIAVASVLTAAAPAFAQYYNPDYQNRDYREYRNDRYERNGYARVLESRPVYQDTVAARDECWNPRSGHFEEVRGENKTRVGKGAAIGAVAGGVIGHQVGGGRGRDLATVAGAVGGGYAGKKIQQGQQDRDTYTTTERRCRTVKEPVEDVAYDVVYEYLGQTHQVRLDHDPGERVELPVRGIE